jgi:hypothetical protein
MIYGNTLDFEWCGLLTVVDTQNNRCGTQTRSQPAKKNGADYWYRLLKWAGTKN